MNVIKYYNNNPLNYSVPNKLEVDFIAGGINMAKREVYEKVGLQDEALFMYGDETDWDLRVKNAGYKLFVTKKAKAWHEHFYEYTERDCFQLCRRYWPSVLGIFYCNRNRLYLLKKHASKYNCWRLLFHNLIKAPRNTWRMLFCGKFNLFIAYYLGLFYGILGLMGRRLYKNK